MQMLILAKSICVAFLFQLAGSEKLRGLGDDELARDSSSLTTSISSLSSRHLQELKSTYSFEGPSFVVGLELNTTHTGQIYRRAIGDVLSTEFFNHLSLELPYKYRLQKVVIEDIQTISVELIRKLEGFQGIKDMEMPGYFEQMNKVKTHTFLVAANTLFSTENRPSKEKINDSVLSIQLQADPFQNSTNPVLRTTVGAKFLPLRTPNTALMIEDVSADTSVLMEYSTLIYLGIAFALLTLLAGITYHTKTSQRSSKAQVRGRIVSEQRERPDISDDALFDASSCSDDSLIQERGLNAEAFSKVVYDVADGMFSCGGGVPSSHESNVPVDIDTSLNDDDSGDKQNFSKRDLQTVSVLNKVIDNGITCVF